MSCFPCIKCYKCRRGLPPVRMVCASCGAPMPPGVAACEKCGCTQRKMERAESGQSAR